MKDSVFLYSETIDIAETDTYLELTNRVCYYDEPNLNNVMLTSENALERAKTLVNMPVVAKYRVNADGEPTFGSHEAYVDENGELQFNTDSVGTHTEVYIEEDTVDVNGVLKTLPCLFAKYRIWTRNANVVAAVKRLFSEDKLYSSWEVITLSYEFKDGIKTLNEYEFIGNCLLGYEFAMPAYGVDAKAITMSNQSPQLLVANALAQDLINSRKKEEVNLSKNKNAKEIIEKATDKNVEKNKKSVADEEKDVTVEDTETSALTDYDLWVKLSQACREKLGEYCYVAFHFPLEKTVWVKSESSESELDYKLFNYTVENDEVEVSEPIDVTLTVSVSEINDKIEKLNSEIEKKNEALITANKTIKSLESEVSTLKPFKEKFEKAEQERIEKELAEKQDELKAYALKSGHITKEEIETSEEIKGYIEKLDKKAIQSIIGDRVVSALEKMDKDANIEVSSIVKDGSLKTNISNADSGIIDYRTVINSFLEG